MEELCQFDLRVMYIMGQDTPSYKVICEFINKYIVPHQYEIFIAITQTIIEIFDLDMDEQYLNGTKIEVNSNKYKFVWKLTTFHRRLDKKIKELLSDMGYVSSNELISSNDVYQKMINYAIKPDLGIQH